MLRHCPNALRGQRDRALLALGFAGAMRRSELVALTVADLEEVGEGLRVHVRRSKTDQEGVGQIVPVLNGSRFKVAEIVKAYAKLAGLDSARFAGHSLRAEFLTSAAVAGASVFKMMEVSWHRSLETVCGYVRDAELFRDHTGSAFL